MRPALRNRILSLVLWALCTALAGTHSRADVSCGAPDTPCMAGDGEYYVALPVASEQPSAVIWLHGYARSGKAMIAKSAYVDPFTRRGYAVIMPSGQPFPGESKLDWGVADGYDWPRDDIAFIRAVHSDAIARFGLDRSRILIAGFSRGGSMVWDVACHAPELATGFAAVAGAFWEPMKTDCAAAVDLFHTHGLNDTLVPFEGREVHFQGIDWVQGSIMKGVDVWRRENGCMGSAKNTFGKYGSMQKDWAKCTTGSVRLRLTKGGHGVPKGWREAVLDWFEALE